MESAPLYPRGTVRRDPKTALTGAALCFTGLVVTGVLALLVPVAEQRDAATLQGFRSLNRGPVTEIADRVASLCDPGPYGVFAVLLVLVALARRRWRLAVAVPLVVFLAPATSQLLKPLLATPRTQDWLGAGQIASAAWPSGHATAAMTLALCGVLVAPARLRPAAGVLGGGLAIAVSYAILVLAWHFPSDVLGGFLVAGLWTSLAVAALLALEERRPATARRPRAAGPGDDGNPVLWPAAAAALGLFAVAVVFGPERLADAAMARPTFALGAASIAALALVLAAALAQALRAR